MIRAENGNLIIVKVVFYKENLSFSLDIFDKWYGWRYFLLYVLQKTIYLYWLSELWLFET